MKLPRHDYGRAGPLESLVVDLGARSGLNGPKIPIVILPGTVQTPWQGIQMTAIAYKALRTRPRICLSFSLVFFDPVLSICLDILQREACSRQSVP